MSITGNGPGSMEKADSAGSELHCTQSHPELKRSRNNTILSPQPSDDPRDPLNWPQAKKIGILTALSVVSFAALGSPLAGLLALSPQAKLYDKQVNEISYGISIALAGMIIGPFALLPLSHAVGRTSAIFWTTFLVLVCNIWGASMTKRSQYTPFLVSRFFAGLGATVPSTLGPRILIDLFFVHERGRAFSVFSLAFLLGPVAPPTVGCFIAAKTEWPIMFWWTIPLLGVGLVLIIIFMEETGFARQGNVKYPLQPSSFLANRTATLLPGNRVVPKCTFSETLQTFTNCITLTVTPVTLAIGLYGLISFGASLMQANMQAIFLLEPIEAGGYGLELEQLAEVSISGWVGVFGAFIYTQLVSDRFPIWICKRRGGFWKNEYRLHCMWLPGLIVLPIGLGLFGASVKQHWSPAMLAVSYFMTISGSYATTSIISNYLVECFQQFPAECGIALSGYRLALGLAAGFFIQPFVKRIGIVWTFGTAAFMSICAFLFIVLLLYKGPAVRRLQLAANLASSNEVIKLTL